jgi:hypothetical protein
MKEKKKTFDAVAFMRKRREELSRAYAGLSAEQIEERIQQALKDDPLWQRHGQTQPPASSEKKTGGCPEWHEDKAPIPPGKPGEPRKHGRRNGGLAR